MMGSKVILADDLTGACDAGVEFAMAGLPAHVWLPGVRNTGEGIHVYDTDTRGLPMEAAAARVSELAQELTQAGASLLYKKIDSTLKGNLGPELRGLREKGLIDGAIIAPGNPRMGRTITGGWLEVYGERGPHLPSMLRAQGLVGVAHIEGEEVAAGAGTIAAHARYLLAAKMTFLVCDTAVPWHLQEIARAAQALGRGLLLTGSAGLAGEVARLMAAGGLRKSYGQPEVPARGMAVYIGSENPVTLRQLDYLMEHRPDGELKIERVRAEELGRPLRQDLLPPRDRRWTIFASGGDTAESVLGAMGAQGIRLAGELAPGVPWGYVRGGAWEGTPVVTKPGGFGAPDTLARVAVLAFRLAEERESNL